MRHAIVGFRREPLLSVVGPVEVCPPAPAPPDEPPRARRQGARREGGIPAPWELHLIARAMLLLVCRGLMAASAALYAAGCALDAAVTTFEATWAECRQQPEFAPGDTATSVLAWQSLGVVVLALAGIGWAWV